MPKCLAVLLVASISAFQIYDTFDDYKKKYISDAKEYLGVLAKDDQSFIMVQDNEYSRVRSSYGRFEKIFKNISAEKDFNRFEDFYDFRGCRLYLALYDKRKENSGLIPFSKTIFKSKSGKKNKNYFTVFSIDTLEKEKLAYSSESAKNHLLNGNLEEIEKKDVSKNKLTKWIAAGCDFYDDESLVLPKHNNLLSYWSAPPKGNYPKVRLSSEHPIEGSHSLLVELQDNNVVFFLNMIERKSGCLSFKIRSLDRKTRLGVREYTSSHDSKLLNSHHIRDIILLDNSVHQISIIVPDRDPDEIKSLFSVTGSNTSFELDDLSYYYLQDK